MQKSPILLRQFPLLFILYFFQLTLPPTTYGIEGKSILKTPLSPLSQTEWTAPFIAEEGAQSPILESKQTSVTTEAIIPEDSLKYADANPILTKRGSDFKNSMIEGTQNFSGKKKVKKVFPHAWEFTGPQQTASHKRKLNFVFGNKAIPSVAPGPRMPYAKLGDPNEKKLLPTAIVFLDTRTNGNALSGKRSNPLEERRIIFVKANSDFSDSRTNTKKSRPSGQPTLRRTTTNLSLEDNLGPREEPLANSSKMEPKKQKNVPSLRRPSSKSLSLDGDFTSPTNKKSGSTVGKQVKKLLNFLR